MSETGSESALAMVATRAAAVIVAIADFVGGDGVVLVDHGLRHSNSFAMVERALNTGGALGILQRLGFAQRQCRDRPAPPTDARQRICRPPPRLTFLELELAARQNRRPPGAIELEDTTSTSRFSPCSLAISAASAFSHAARTSPLAASISSDEPTLTTIRRKFFSAGRFMAFGGGD